MRIKSSDWACVKLYAARYPVNNKKCSSNVNLTGINGNVIMSGCAMATVTMQDEKRIEIIRRVFRGELTALRAAVILGLSERQCYRIKR